jgi:hypothetical protein
MLHVQNILKKFFVLFTIVAMVSFAYTVTKNSLKMVKVNLTQLVEEEEERQVREVPEVELVLLGYQNSQFFASSDIYNFSDYLALKEQHIFIPSFKPPSV